MNAMVHAAGDELSDKFVDFSVGWLKDDEPTFKDKKIKNRKRLTSVKNAEPLANRNISNIVSRIRDEGAAFGSNDSKIDKQTRQAASTIRAENTPTETTMTLDDSADDMVTLSSKSNKVAAPEKQKNSRNISKSSFSAVCDQPIEMAANEIDVGAVKLENKTSRKKQFTLIFIVGLVVVVVLGYMSYQFKLQSNEMKQALLMYQQSMDEGKKNNGQSPVVITAVKNKSLSILKQAAPVVMADKQKAAIAGGIKPVDVKDSIVVAKSNDIETKLMTAVDDNKIELVVEVPVKSKISVKPLPIKKAEVKAYIAADKPIMFTVNLASFSESTKAYQQLSVFEALGVSPIVEQAVVGSKTIYRLCVEGFSSREEAGLFISRLNRKHEINAWVRQG